MSCLYLFDSIFSLILFIIHDQDIFDEITEDDISPAWDFNLSKPFRVISSSKKIIDVVMNLEKAIQEV